MKAPLSKEQMIHQAEQEVLDAASAIYAAHGYRIPKIGERTAVVACDRLLCKAVQRLRELKGVNR